MALLIKPILYRIAVSLTAFLFLSIGARGQKTDTLFLSDEVINMTLSSHFSEIRADTAKDPKPHPGKLTYNDPGR